MTSRFTTFFNRYLLFIERRLFWIWLRLTHNPRPSSYPYVTGDSFRALADHIYDETQTLNPELVKKGDIVFVSNLLILPYLQSINPKIKFPYILIEHNGDNPIGEEVMSLLDEKIIRFYAQDAIIDHPKLIPIPLALENLRFYYNGIPRVFNKLRRQIKRNPPQRKNKIFFNFSIDTNPEERGPAKELFLKNPLMETVTEMLLPPIHLKKLTTYKFVVSPPGHAIESSRTYEALYLNTIPIIKDLVPSRYFSKIGLPVWIVKEWDELEGLSEEEVLKKYDALMQDANFEALYMDFWINKIKEDQQSARSH